MRPNGLRNVLERLISKVLKTRRHFAANGQANRLGRDDAACRSDALKTSCHIDAVSIHGAVGLLHHIAQMQAQAESQTAVLWNGIRAGLDFVLDGNRRCGRAGGRLEDRQHRIARCIDDSAAICDADRLEGLPCGVERLDRASIVRGH